MDHTKSSELADDLLKGLTAIAKFLGETNRRTHYLCQQKLIPAFQLGHLWYARRSAIVGHVRHLETLESNVTVVPKS